MNTLKYLLSLDLASYYTLIFHPFSRSFIHLVPLSLLLSLLHAVAFVSLSGVIAGGKIIMTPLLKSDSESNVRVE